MRKMKILLPVLLTLLSTALLLAAFGATAMTADEAAPAPVWEAQSIGSYNAATVTTSNDSTEIDLTGYAVVCSGNGYTRAYAQKIADRLSDLTGETVPLTNSSSGVKRAIYVGQANGVCQQALKQNGMTNTKCGWSVTLVDKNIALAGTNALIALEAVDYFFDTYLANADDATITVANNHKVIYPDEDIITVFQPATKTDNAGVITYGTDGSTQYSAVIYDQNLDHDASYNNDKDPDTEYSKINMSSLKDTDATGYSLDKSPGTFAYVKDSSHDNSSYKAGVIGYDGDYLLVNGNRVTVPADAFNGSRGQTFSITSDGLVQIRNRGVFSSDYHTIDIQGLGGDVGTANDYVYDRAALLANIIATNANVVGTIAHKPDSTAATTYEILVGKVAGRTEDDTVLATLAPYEYGIAVVNGKIVLTGHSIETQQYAAYLFYEVMISGLLGTTTQADDGVKTTTYKPVYLPNDYSLVGTSLTNWGANANVNYQKPADRIADAVLPDLTYTDVADANDGTLVIAYRNGATLNAFNTYCAKLKSNGYVAITESTLSGSYFKTFVNYENGITIHASYCAFTGKEDYSVGQQWGSNLTEKYFAYSDPQIRLSIAHLSSVDLPSAEILDPNQKYVKVTDSAITSLDMSVAKKDGEYVAGYGTGYAMMLEDGRFILIDGGQALGGTDDGYDPWAQVDTIYNVLEDLYIKAFGEAPSEEKPITIAAWILTHGHSDHIAALWDFSHKYGAGEGCTVETCYCKNGAKKNNVVLQNLFANTPARSLRYNAAEANEDITLQMEKWQRYFGGFNYVKVHIGQVFYFANLTVEVLATPEDLYPQRIVTFNDTSNIMRLTFRNTTAADGATVELDNSNASDGVRKTSFMSTGDIYIHTSRFVTSMYGTDLKADMVSMGHHGGPGAEGAFYDMVAAEAIWWSMSVENVCGGYSTGSGWFHRIDQYAAWGSSYTKYIFVADATPNQDVVKAANLTLYLRSTGPDYENLYNAGDVNLDDAVDSTDEANRSIAYSTTLPTFNGKNTAMSNLTTYQSNLAVAYKRS